MQPVQIYALPDIATQHQAQDVFGILLDDWHCHIPEIGDNHYFQLPEDTPLKIRIHVNPYIDYERSCVVGSLWWHGCPVMVFRHAGRGGHDQYDRFITDQPAYQSVVKYLRKFLTPPPPPEDVCSAGDDIADLDRFYGFAMTDLISNLR